MIRHIIVLVVLGLLTTACTVEGLTAVGEPTASPAVVASPDPSSDEISGTTWAPDAVPVDLPGGWQVRDCEGDAPLLCVDHAGEIAGTLLPDSFPLTPELAAAQDEAALTVALREFAAASQERVAGDRLEGCGASYEFAADEVADVVVGGLPGVRYGFRGTERGQPSEYVLGYATVAAGQLWLVVAEGASDTGCMADAELDLFTPEALQDFRPALDGLLGATPLPAAGTRVEDGTVVGVDGGLDGGLVYVLVDGHKRRVQQPRPLAESDVAYQGLVFGDHVVRIESTGRPTGSSFVVVPPDGPHARLYLLQDGTLRPIVVQAVEPTALDGIPDAVRPELGDLRPAVVDR